MATGLTLSAWRDLTAGLRRSRSELAGLQLSRLQEVVEHAYANVPYYRRLFDSCTAPGVRAATADS